MHQGSLLLEVGMAWCSITVTETFIFQNPMISSFMNLQEHLHQLKGKAKHQDNPHIDIMQISGSTWRRRESE